MGNDRIRIPRAHSLQTASKTKFEVAASSEDSRGPLGFQLYLGVNPPPGAKLTVTRPIFPKNTP